MTALIDEYRTDHQHLVEYVCQLAGISAGKQQESPDRARREKMAQRLRLYRDDATTDVASVIRMVFDTELAQTERIKLIDISKEQNVTRRIVNQIASLYDRPARREVKDAARFKVEEKRTKLHEIMQQAHRLTNLCNEVLVWQFTGIDGKSRLRVVTPNMFTAIPSPRDQLHMAGVLIDRAPLTLLTGDAKARLPHFELWDDTYRYLINMYGHIVDEAGEPATPIEHKLKRIPAVLLHRAEPSESLMESREGTDITSAHLGVMLLEVMIMRLSKSQGERQPILQGNLANVMRGQSMNGEGPIVLPPEVVASVLDTQTDPGHYLDVQKNKVAGVAAGYGMSAEFITNGDDGASASGTAYKVRREKLTELRLEQRRRAVQHEADVVDLMGFDIDTLRLDYQEQAIPQDAAEELSLLKDKMKLGLDSPIDYLMRKDPDLTRETALAKLKANLSDWAELVTTVRALNMPADADADNAGRSPQENGANRDADAKDVPRDPTQHPETGTATAA